VKHGTGEFRNVTIALPLAIIREAKHAAVDEGLSLSGFVAKILEERLQQAAQYRKAAEVAKRAMREGMGYRVGGAKWTRDELHER